MVLKDSRPWVDGMTMGQVFARTVEQNPDHEAVIFPDLKIRLTYRELDEQVKRAARGLLAMEVQAGQHVAVWATNVPEWIILQMASARVGAVLVTINPAYRVREFKYALAQSDSVALFLVDRFKTSDYFAMLERSLPTLGENHPGTSRFEDFPHLRWAITLKGNPPAGTISWTDMLALGDSISDSELEKREEALQPSDPINIQYTSGTTGFPKAAILSHRNLLMNAFHVGECQGISPGSRICIPVPFYHCFGCVLGTLCAIVHGATMVIPAEYFNAEATLNALEEEEITAVYGVPTMFISMLEHPTMARRKLKSLRTGIMAGSPCPVKVMRQVMEQMGAAQLTIAYGLTEASPVVTQTRVDDPIELRVESVGRPIPGVEIKIIDPKTAAVLEQGQPGELCVKGHGVMRGYYKDPKATAHAIDDEGWLRSGDLALVRPDGYVQITGRIKDMVIRGGENVYPREIEEVLINHPAVEDVAVVGIPDPQFGEELCAWIRLKASEEASLPELQDFCREELAHFKIPRYFKFVDSFPQTVTGKVQKFKIRDTMIAELNLTGKT